MSDPRTEVQHGLEGVIAFDTQIAEPDKEGSALRYRGVDIEDLKRRIGSFMAKAIGGPSDYQGPTLRDVHGRMAINDEVFDQFVGCFEGVLTELGAGTEQSTQVLALLNGVRGEVLNR